MNTIKRLVRCCPVWMLLLCANARADIYTCKDNAGHLITSDHPIPECADKAVQIYQNNGVLKKQLDPQQTDEQRKAAQLRQQQQAQQAVQQDNIRREQRYLTAHYASETAIETARQKALGSVETKIVTEQRAIEAANQELSKNRNALAVTPKNQLGRIQDLQLKIDDLNQSIEESTHLINSYRAEQSNINHDFDATHQRYHELITNTR